MILWRFLSGVFLRYFFIIFVALVFFYVAIDTLMGLKNFADFTPRQSLRYIALTALVATNYILPISLVLALVLGNVALIRSGEFVSFFALGAGRSRVVLPAFALSLLITAGYVGLNFTDFAYARATQKQLRAERDFTTHDLFLQGGGGFVFIRSLSPASKEARGVEVFVSQDGKLARKIIADGAVYVENGGGAGIAAGAGGGAKSGAKNAPNSNLGVGGEKNSATGEKSGAKTSAKNAGSGFWQLQNPRVFELNSNLSLGDVAIREVFPAEIFAQNPAKNHTAAAKIPAQTRAQTAAAKIPAQTQTAATPPSIIPQILPNLTPEALAKLGGWSAGYSVTDALLALRAARQTQLATNKIATALYTLTIFPFFAPFLLVIIYFRLPLVARFGNLALWSSGAILAALLVWGVLFLLVRFSENGALNALAGVVAPVVLLGLWAARLLWQNR